MTIRAVVLGLVVSVFVATFGYFNDEVLRLNAFVGNHFPISVFGLLLVVMIGVNPLLHSLSPRWRLRPAELAVVLVFVLAACSIPGSGLMRTFTTTLAVPAQMNAINTGWHKNAVLSYVPEGLLPDDGRISQEVIADYLAGKGRPGRWISPAAVPWAAWAAPIARWGPLVTLCLVGAVGLSLVVHRQWVSRERLRYPIALVTSMCVESGPKHALGPLYRQRSFWWGLAAVLGLRIVDGLGAWFPGMIEIETEFRFDALRNLFPSISQVEGSWGLITCRLFPVVIAFSYFLASDVGLSLGISKLAWVLVGMSFYAWGIDSAGGGYFAGGPLSYLTFGAYLGLTIMLVFTGRDYYWRVCRAALGLGRDARIESTSVWGARVFLLCSGAMVVLLRLAMGLETGLAVLTVGLLFMMFLGIARISAETGLFFIQTNWQAFTVIFGLFGAAALGPRAMIVIGLVSVLLAIDPRECLMPFVVNGLRVADHTGVRVGRAGTAAALAATVALATAVPFVLWANYNWGKPNDPWATESVPAFTFDQASKSIDSLRSAGQLDTATHVSGLDRLKHVELQRGFGWATLTGLALFVGFSVARLRFAWWPLHPVLFLVWTTYPMNMFAWSFFLGWCIKSAVVGFGGIHGYEKGKPLMVGVIAGDVLGGLIFIGASLAYYRITGIEPRIYSILPG